MMTHRYNYRCTACRLTFALDNNYHFQACIIKLITCSPFLTTFINIAYPETPASVQILLSVLHDNNYNNIIIDWLIFCTFDLQRDFPLTIFAIHGQISVQTTSKTRPVILYFLSLDTLLAYATYTEHLKMIMECLTFWYIIYHLL